jgi:hypothetical protein
MVRRAIKSGDIRRGDPDANDLLRDLVGVSNAAILTRFFEDRPHKDTTDTIV